jgi:hypothetical protein
MKIIPLHILTAYLIFINILNFCVKGILVSDNPKLNKTTLNEKDCTLLTVRRQSRRTTTNSLVYHCFVVAISNALEALLSYNCGYYFIWILDIIKWMLFRCFKSVTKAVFILFLVIFEFQFIVLLCFRCFLFRDR